MCVPLHVMGESCWDCIWNCLAHLSLCATPKHMLTQIWLSFIIGFELSPFDGMYERFSFDIYRMKLVVEEHWELSLCINSSVPF